MHTKHASNAARQAAMLLLVAGLAGFSSNAASREPTSRAPIYQKGKASFYGARFEGRRTANGERFRARRLTAAHRTLAFGTRVRVTRPDTGETVVVRINDRGPWHGNRVIDLSRAAARELGMIKRGVAPVTLRVLGTR